MGHDMAQCRAASWTNSDYRAEYGYFHPGYFVHSLHSTCHLVFHEVEDKEKEDWRSVAPPILLVYRITLE